ncbi:MAG: chromosome segregation protein SMC [Methylococcaceae bacterium]|nr:MAG: chromosome segregation protein SMC [Methylococcaceae bacterium]
MRLDTIKLAGFKSFVDPTTLPLPSNLVGIVGPNGCGKSNIIDAVRWVMGESSAKHLRGESMSDVVFNGSSTRKPVSQASVELVFDNSDGSAPGEFATFSEISVRRQVTRDGQSTYLLNGTRCRRKDITDIFLGTGLGPRSYAIIEQGTISRLIEARPEEMRSFIEEAAGISKYKERRHETEIRMRHTRENLDRLNDLRDEITKQLASLQRQANKAEKYLALRDEERRYRRELLALRWRQYDRLCQEQQQAIAGLAEELSALAESDRELALSQEQRQSEHGRLQQSLEQVQGRFYGVSADIARLEQSIRNAEKSRAEMEKERQRLEQEAAQAARELADDQGQMEHVREELLNLEQGLRDSEAREEEAAELREEAARRHQDSQQRRDAARSESARFHNQIEVQRTRLRHLGEDAARLASRRQRLEGEKAELAASLDLEGLEELQQEVAELELRLSDTREIIQELELSLQGSRDRMKTLRETLHSARSEWQQVTGRVASLELLQQHAMGKDNSALRQWLDQAGLSAAPRLAECLEVQPGWESAVEKVLERYLQAVCVDDLAAAAAQLPALQNQSLALVTKASGPPHSNLFTAIQNTAPRLSEQVSSSWAIDGLLGSVYCAADVDAAQQIAAGLAMHESVVTPDGVRLGSHWLLVQREHDERSGVLQREKELRALREAEQQLAAQSSACEASIAELEQARRDQEARRGELQRSEQGLAASLSKRSAELAAARTRMEQAQKRLHQLQEELAEIAESQRHNGEEKAEAELSLSEAEQGFTEHQTRLTSAEADVAAAQERLHQATSQAQAARETLHGLRARRATLSSSQELTAKHLERIQQHSRQAAERMAELNQRLSGSEQPMIQEREELAGLLDERVSVEAELARSRRALEEATVQLRKLAEQRSRVERDNQRVREKLEQARVEIQSMLVRRQTQQEQLTEADENLEAVLEQLSEEAEEGLWQTRLTALQEDIQRLGAINLTAMEEHQTQSERAVFLEQQYTDLTESLATLEQAIEKIDQECRNLFKDTFDKVNGGLQKKFPVLFGGGTAYLELHDQDMLSSGVTIMARPPGKRNSSIHLLSGGEKALTAVALVFSIFELNPAPFCLLDEVDAPLDEANVGRFSRLVKEMSEAVQFLFITHNKGTMEIAEQLAGVTMKEPGVSRIVAVDIDKAVELAGV